MEKKDLNNEEKEIIQEEMAQKALGNTTSMENTVENNNDLLTIPKISGTGSNHSAPTSHSVIVHEDEEGEDRYENGSDQSTIKK